MIHRVLLVGPFLETKNSITNWRTEKSLNLRSRPPLLGAREIRKSINNKASLHRGRRLVSLRARARHRVGWPVKVCLSRLHTDVNPEISISSWGQGAEEGEKGGTGMAKFEGREGGGKLIDTLTEPLMYVIDLLCDALALRVPDRLSSSPDARGSQWWSWRNGRILMERGGKGIPEWETDSAY